MELVVLECDWTGITGDEAQLNWIYAAWELIELDTEPRLNTASKTAGSQFEDRGYRTEVISSSSDPDHVPAGRGQDRGGAGEERQRVWHHTACRACGARVFSHYSVNWGFILNKSEVILWKDKPRSVLWWVNEAIKLVLVQLRRETWIQAVYSCISMYVAKKTLQFPVYDLLRQLQSVGWEHSPFW